MQNELINNNNNQIPPNIPLVANNIEKKKDWLMIIVIPLIIILIAIIFNDSLFITFSAIISLPVIIIYLLSRNTYRGVSSSGISKRSTFYSLIFLLDIIIFIVIPPLLFRNHNNGLDFTGLYEMIALIFFIIIFTITSIIFYETRIKKYNK